MTKYYTTDTELKSIADAIREKGGTSAALTYPSGFVSAIEAIQTGGSGGVEIVDTLDEHGGTVRTITTGNKIVVFIDYDGTVVASKTKAEIDAMTSDSDLPANPTHTGLTAQGWNWTLAQIKAQLTACPDGDVIVGQMYVTTSGKTEIDITISEGTLIPYLQVAINGTIEVDWGDNTTPNTKTGTSLSTRLSVGPHQYASPGNYTISISVTTGEFVFYTSASYSFLTNGNTLNRAYTACIKNVRTGNGLRRLDDYAFLYCTSMETITINRSINNDIQNCIFQNCYSLKSITIPNGATKIRSYAFCGCYNIKYISIPNSVQDLSTSNIFQYCYSLKSITIPNGTTSLGSYFLMECRLINKIELPSGITSIGSYAFSSCHNIKSIKIPNTVTSIGNSALETCYTLKTCILPNAITSLGKRTFYGCYSLESITIPNTVTSIGESVFQACYNLKSITIPSGVTSISKSTFQNCGSITSITIPNTVTSIGENAFYSCYSLQSITLPNVITSIPKNAFYYCYSIKSITLPNNLTSIGESAFYNCTSLGEITIPSGVTSIGNSAFMGCTYAWEIHILPTSVPTAGTSLFGGYNSNRNIYVPQGKLNDYQTATNWSDYASRMQEEPT